MTFIHINAMEQRSEMMTKEEIENIDCEDMGKLLRMAITRSLKKGH